MIRVYDPKQETYVMLAIPIRLIRAKKTSEPKLKPPVRPRRARDLDAAGRFEVVARARPCAPSRQLDLASRRQVGVLVRDCDIGNRITPIPVERNVRLNSTRWQGPGNESAAEKAQGTKAVYPSGEKNFPAALPIDEEPESRPDGVPEPVDRPPDRRKSHQKET
jgi:hypothetical protein